MGRSKLRLFGFILATAVLMGGVYHSLAQVRGTTRAPKNVASRAVQSHMKAVAQARRARAHNMTAIRKSAAVRRENAVRSSINATRRTEGGPVIGAEAMPMPGGVPDYFNFPNWANSPMPTVDPVTGVISGGIRKFVDSLPGLGAAGANNLGQFIPVAAPNTTAYPGSDYYEIELVEYTQKMHSDLQPTTLRGYRQTNNGTDANGQNTIVPPAEAHYLGPLIVAQKGRPVRIKFTNNLPTGEAGKLFLPVDTTVMGAGMGPDGTDYTQNRATLHLHGGLVPWISDGTQHQWTVPAGESTTLKYGAATQNVPDMGGNLGDGTMSFYYPNDQSARLMFYHDHAYGITRLNVYAGEAAGYLLQDDTEKSLVSSGVIPADQIPLIIQDKTFVDPTTVQMTDPTWPFPLDATRSNLWLPHVYMQNQNPAALDGVNPFGRWDYGPWFWPPWPTAVSSYPLGTLDPNGNWIPQTDPVTGDPMSAPGVPDLSTFMEAFMDTPLVNGTAYPYLEVQPKAYRFRILNAANDRFWNLGLYVADPAKPTEIKAVPAYLGALYPGTQVPIVYPDAWKVRTLNQPGDILDFRDSGVPDPGWNPTTGRFEGIGPEMIQIGTEGGFLPAPVVWSNSPIGFDRDPKSMTVGNVKEHNLFLGPAERADVIVDFSQYAGQTLILYNDAPAAVPAADLRVDYYTGHADLSDSGGTPPTLPGYGPNTRTIMQIRVAPADPLNPPVAYDPTALQAALPAAFKVSQDPIIVPQAPYNAVYGGNFPSGTGAYVRLHDTSISFTPLGGTAPVSLTFMPKAIAEEFEDVFGRMSAFLGVELPFTNGGNQTTIFYTVKDPASEVLSSPDPTVAISPIDVMSDGTQIWKITHNGVDTHPIHFHLFNVQVINRVDWGGVVKPPDANELGWKETVRMNPLEDCIVAFRPRVPAVPWELPNSVRPLDPTMPIGATDEMYHATVNGQMAMGTIPLGLFKRVDVFGNPVTVANQLANFGWEYVWHCHILGHEEMDMMRPIAVAVKPVTPSGLAGGWAAPTYNTVVLTWNDVINESSYAIERSLDGATWTPAGTAAMDQPTFTDTTATPGKTYIYRVKAVNAVGSGIPGYPLSTLVSEPSIPVTVLPPLPAAPNNVKVTASAPGVNPLSVKVQWGDQSTNELGFIIERGLNGVYTPVGQVGANVTNWTDTIGLQPITTYTYRVAAFNDAGKSVYANGATATTPSAVAPAAPSNLRITATANNNLTMAWNDNSNNELSFEIQRLIGTTWTTVGTVGANVTTYRDNGLSRRTTYQYRVRAVNGWGASAYSGSVPGTTR